MQMSDGFTNSGWQNELNGQAPRKGCDLISSLGMLGDFPGMCT